MAGNVIGASDAFVGGYVAARCRRCSATVALLWGFAAALLTTQESSAQLESSLAELTAFTEEELGIKRTEVFRSHAAGRMELRLQLHLPRLVSNNLHLQLHLHLHLQLTLRLHLHLHVHLHLQFAKIGVAQD